MKLEPAFGGKKSIDVAIMEAELSGYSVSYIVAPPALSGYPNRRGIKFVIDCSLNDDEFKLLTEIIVEE